MKRTLTIKFFSLLLACAPLSFVHALEPINTGNQLEDSVLQSNRRSALRCLALASDSASIKNWNGAISQASLGLAYDDSISDLWYILAVSNNELGRTKAEILPQVETALKKENWVNYNRDGARILYADLLCDTLRFDEVEGVLNSAPKLFSQDAEYIRAKAYYRINTSSSIQKAREIIESARKIFPDDTRFPLLLFQMEDRNTSNNDVKRMVSFFIKQVTQYVEAAPDKDAELEIYAASFASGIDRIHLLESFKARDLSHPLYAQVAMEAGILSQREALRYLVNFADQGIDFDILKNFIYLLQDENVIDEAAEYFGAYSGVIYRDTDGDGLENMFVKYSRGRPQTVGYDENQDGVLSWTIACDFGVPSAGSLNEEHMEFSWNDFPYLKKVTFKNEKGNELYSYDLVSESLAWAPFTIRPHGAISALLETDFFFPELNLKGENLDQERLLKSTSGFSMPSSERKGARIHFVTLNGHIQYARYMQNGKMYAQAQFENDMPVLRNVDADSDGIFETTEFYAVDEKLEMFHTMDEEKSVLTNIYGKPSNAAPFYLRMIQIDRDHDTIPDFTEEYIAGNGKITSWDNDNNGKWEIRYVRYGQEYDGEGNELPLVEDAMFYQNGTKNLITVRSVGGKPDNVHCGAETLHVLRDSTYPMYWVGKTGTPALAKVAVNNISSREQGFSMILQVDDVRMMVVKVGSCIFGNIIE